MQPRLLPAVVLGFALLLTGCAKTPAVQPAPSTTPAAESASPSATPEPTPESAGELVVGIDGITYEHDGQTQDYPFESDGEYLLALVEELTGEPRQGVPIEGPYGSDWGTGYEWDEMSVIVHNEENTSVRVSSPTVGEVPITTTEGLSVGSSRDEVVAAGGRDGWDEDQDGVADYMDLGEQEVPGTQSLARPGEVGILFVLVELDDDTVVEIQSPANDFSDI